MTFRGPICILLLLPLMGRRYLCSLMQCRACLYLFRWLKVSPLHVHSVFTFFFPLRQTVDRTLWGNIERRRKERARGCGRQTDGFYHDSIRSLFLLQRERLDCLMKYLQEGKHWRLISSHFYSERRWANQSYPTAHVSMKTFFFPKTFTLKDSKVF